MNFKNRFWLVVLDVTIAWRDFFSRAAGKLDDACSDINKRIK